MKKYHLALVIIKRCAMNATVDNFVRVIANIQIYFKYTNSANGDLYISV